ncbi:MAG: PucR family transcriptional regulator [Lachnospiraceae bacterium]|jgi:carbohydrate diacid regulator
MISNQLLQTTIDKIKAISGTDLAILDLTGAVIVRTYTDDAIDADQVVRFVRSQDEEMDFAGNRLFKIKDEMKNEFVLAVRNNGRDSALAGSLAKYQLETLFVAYKERFDKDNFFKSLLMDNMLVIDIFDRARKLHIEMEAYRAVLIVELGDRNRNEVIDIIRGIFFGNTEGFVTAINKKDVIVIKTVDGPDSCSQLDNLAKKIQDVVKRDADEDVRISYGSIVADLKEMSKSYKEARMAMDVSHIFFEDRSINPYNKLDIGRLIYQLPLPLCKLFIKEIFGDMSLEDMDKETITTINKFFENSLNVSETSRQLYIHRNTLVYRLDKIQKTTGLDLRVFKDAITFKIALMVSKYMKYIEAQK